MTQNVAQWLDEIKGLKQRLSEAQNEREEAYASAVSWQRLYETEAQQRRVDAETARQSIATIQQEIQQFKGNNPDATKLRIQADVDRLESDTDVRSRLVQALADCDRLAQALETEKANHMQTRKSLTTALGDAIDALKSRS
jgi:chromosome segregation ATPase